MGQAPCLEFVDHPVCRKEQQLGVGIGHKEGGNDILFFGLHPCNALAATLLGTEIDKWCALNVAARGHSHDHVFFFDQVFVFHVARPVNDLSAARNRELVSNFGQLIRNDTHDPLAGAQNFKVFLDLSGEFFQLVGDFLNANLGQALQAQFKNSARLDFGQVIRTVVICRMGRIINQGDVGQDVSRRPAACHQFMTRF